MATTNNPSGRLALMNKEFTIRIIFFVFILVGLIIKILILPFVSSNASDDKNQDKELSNIIVLNIVSLGIIAGSLFFLSMILVASGVSKGKLATVIILLLIISWLLSIYLANGRILSSNNLPKEYNTFSSASTYLLLGELALLYQYVQNTILKGGTDNRPAWILAVLETIHLVVVAIIQIIVKFYITDG